MDVLSFERDLNSAGAWFFLNYYEIIKKWSGSKDDLVDYAFKGGFDKTIEGTRARVNAVLRIIGNGMEYDVLEHIKNSVTINKEHPEATELASDLQTKYKNEEELPEELFMVPKRLSSYDDDLSPDWRFNNIIFYDSDVSEEEKIPGLRSFLMAEYGHIVSSRGRFLLDDYNAAINDRLIFIPVVLSKEKPIKKYHESDYYILEKVKEAVRNKSSIDEIQKILDSQDWTERILGTYHHSGCPYPGEYCFGNDWPYIKLYFTNTFCPDVEAYKAMMGNCLAHEYFHFYHDRYAGKMFFDAYEYRDNVIEGLADFFSVAYSLDQSRFGSGSDREAMRNYANKRYEEWKEKQHTAWPYAAASFMYEYIDGNEYNFEDTLHPAVREKFNDVLRASKKSMELAFEELYSI